MLPTIRRRTTTPTLWDNSDFDRLFDWALGSAPSLSGWTPAVDVRETGDEYLVIAELPGMSPDNVEVTVENGVLSISGEKKEEFEEGDKRSDRHVYERRYGRFQRNFSLPRSVDADGVKAEFENGLLRVTLPKAAVAKPRKIKIGK